MRAQQARQVQAAQQILRRLKIYLNAATGALIDPEQIAAAAAIAKEDEVGVPSGGAVDDDAGEGAVRASNSAENASNGTGVAGADDGRATATATALADGTANGTADNDATAAAGATQDEDPAAAEEEKEEKDEKPVTERVLYYPVFESKILPLLPTLFESTQEKSSGGETATDLPVGEKGGKQEQEAGASEAEAETERASAEESAAVQAPKSEGVFNISVSTEDSMDDVIASLMALLPTPQVPPVDPFAIPPSEDFQLYRKPGPRMTRRPVADFKILEMLPSESGQSGEATGEERDAAAAVGGEEGVSGDAAPDVATDAGPQSRAVGAFRWIVQPQQTVSFRVLFTAQAEGKSESVLAFEAIGATSASSRQEFSLFCHGTCTLPCINEDPRNLFMRRVKAIPPSMPPPCLKYVLSEKFYSFGPVLNFKKPEWRMLEEEATAAAATAAAEGEAGVDLPAAVGQWALVKSTNGDHIRLTNAGRYKCTVSLGLEASTQTEDDGSVTNLHEVFFVEPSSIELGEGETKDVAIWAFPQVADRLYRNTLVACVSDQPQPLAIPLRVWGVTPNLSLKGPWTALQEAAQAALDSNEDPKKTKELEVARDTAMGELRIEFERILLGKSDTRTFTVKNEAALPAAWKLVLGDFSDSELLEFRPREGQLAVGEEATISLTFSSPDAHVLSGNFRLGFTDIEGGFNLDYEGPGAAIATALSGGVSTRQTWKTLSVSAEAYKVTAVSLTAEGGEEGGNEVDFGLVRVGDQAKQTVQMANKGKYRIGFRIAARSAQATQLLSVTPAEGEIEMGETAPLEVVFCAPNKEVTLSAMRDLRVEIFEPVTGERVEELPLFISARAVFNRVRVQPGKGVSFGALKFDAPPRTKRCEVRNEGSFPFLYVLCADSAEVHEIDALDDAAYAAFAFATPQARRASEMGEEYRKRLGIETADDAPAAGGKAGKAAPTKGGKGGAGAAAAPEMSHANPLVFDADELTLAALPTDPLVVGAFSAEPRLGLVAPGESMWFDVAFDPSGGETSRERIKVLVSGADPADPGCQFLRSFDLNGESCVPAIVQDDCTSIFEEQVVVGSLGEVLIPGQPAPMGQAFYGEEQKTLSFGPVLALTGHGSAGSASSASASATSAPNAEGEAPGANTLASRPGVVERIKITNPTKVDTRVSFTVQASGDGNKAEAAAAAAAAGKGGKGGKGAKGATGGGAAGVDEGESAFSVFPGSWDIPPHEHRFVSVHFKPSQLKVYKAQFTASVDVGNLEVLKGASKQSLDKKDGLKDLIFGLEGSGTLPTVAVIQPSEQDSETGSLRADFGRVHIERRRKQTLTLRNDGVMAATCLFDLSGDTKDFSFQAANASVEVGPGASVDLEMTFSPTVLGSEAARVAHLRIQVLNNPFDMYVVELKGQVFECDATLLPLKSVFAGAAAAGGGPSSPARSSAASSAGSSDGNVSVANSKALGEHENDSDADPDVHFEPLNLLTSLAAGEGPSTTQGDTQMVALKSRCAYPLKFCLSVGPDAPDGTAAALSFSPQVGHLAPFSTREIALTLAPAAPLALTAAPLQCSLTRIDYSPDPNQAALVQTGKEAADRLNPASSQPNEEGEEGGGGGGGGAATATVPEGEEAQALRDAMRAGETAAAALEAERALWGLWDDSMCSVRPATDQEVADLEVRSVLFLLKPFVSSFALQIVS
jgi:hypothetical protein